MTDDIVSRKGAINKPVRNITGTVSDAWYARCGWSVGFLDCEGLEVPYSASTWWMYCINPTCPHHAGEGYDDEIPPWIAFEPGSLDQRITELEKLSSRSS